MSNGQQISDAFLTVFNGYNCCMFLLGLFDPGSMGCNPSLAPLEINDGALTAALNDKLLTMSDFRIELIETPASGPENTPLMRSLPDFTLQVVDTGNGVVTIFSWNWDRDPSFIENDSTYRFRIVAESCSIGTTNAGNGFFIDTVCLNGSNGREDRTVAATFGDFLEVTVLKPIAGGNGRFVIHANTGDLTASSGSILPFGIGTSCFPLLTSSGATPVIVANNIGRTGSVGESNYFGVPTEDPDPARSELSYPALPQGTVLTFQGLIIDPASAGTKAVSLTNAVTVVVQ